MYECFAYIYIYVAHVCLVPLEIRTQYQILLGLELQSCKLPICMLGIKMGSSTKTSALNQQADYPAFLEVILKRPFICI